MPRGGFRIGSGRPRGSKNKKKAKGLASGKQPATGKAPPVIDAGASTNEDMTPLEYMLMVINDPEADKDSRDKMAIAAAPYCHPKADFYKSAKQDWAAKAATAGKGKFKTGKAPQKVINLRERPL